MLFLSVCLLSILSTIQASSDLTAKPGTFFYFAYGSNLLSNRMHVNCKTAEFITRGELYGYRLDFNLTSMNWRGAVATIAKDNSSTIWGALWQIALNETDALDEQEGVNDGWYYPINVTVLADTKEKTEILARTYIEYNTPTKLPDRRQLPRERQPSRTYHRVMYLGACETKLPASYIEYIDSFPDNGNVANPEKIKKLGYPFYGDGPK